jgi:hypothetical protein
MPFSIGNAGMALGIAEAVADLSAIELPSPSPSPRS